MKICFHTEIIPNDSHFFLVYMCGIMDILKGVKYNIRYLQVTTDYVSNMVLSHFPHSLSVTVDICTGRSWCRAEDPRGEW